MKVKISIFNHLFLLLLGALFSCGNESTLDQKDPSNKMPNPPMPIDLLCGKDLQCRSLATIYVDNFSSYEKTSNWMKLSTYCSWNRVKCNAQGEIEELDLSGRFEKEPLTILSEKRFEGLPKLRKLNLSGQRLKTISKDAFVGLSTLETLLLNKCEIEQLPDFVFSPLVSLKTLNLSDNSLPFISKDLFSSLKTLEELDLSWNEIRHIDYRAFLALQKLESLSLAGNEIYALFLDHFSPLENLTSLDLSDNYLSSLDTKDNVVNTSILEKLLNLEELYLGGNNLTSIKKDWLTSLNKLKTLMLWDNQISEIDVDAFSNLTDLNELDLSYNLIKPSNLPQQVFAHNIKLTRLSLSNNNLGDEDLVPKGLQTDWFTTLTQLTRLDLSGNHIKTLPANCFQKLNQLSVLILNENEIEKLDDPNIFSGLATLSELDIASTKLSSLKKDSFSKLGAVTKLVLYAPISNLENGAFQGLTHITQFDLVGTKLTTLSKNQLSGLDQLQNFGIAYNNLLTSFDADTFNDLKNLNTLTIDENPLLTWDASMTKLCEMGRMPKVMIQIYGTPGFQGCHP